MELKHVPLSAIIESPVALRTVDKATEKYQEIVGSVREVGILNPVLLRPRKDEDGNDVYEIIEGLHRTTAARDAGLKEIPAQIVEADDARVMEMQTIGNLARVDTKPSEYREHLKRMLSMNPLLTESEMAKKLSVSTKWIQDRLSLNKINNPEVLDLIDKGKITLANAFTLAKLPEEEQSDFFEAAMLDPAAEFSAKVSERVKELKDAKRKGAAAQKTEFEPVAHLRKISELKSVVDGDEVEGLDTLIRDLGPAEAFVMAIRWSLHLDPESVAKQKAEWDARVAERDERAKKRQAEIAERKRERAELAAKLAENAKAEMAGEEIPHPDVVDKGETETED